ncbi:MAG: LLM class flavin-dependent oxidoreductase [Acidimicrobiales bacterium]
MVERSGTIRIGVGLGPTTSSEPKDFAALIDGLEALGFDSLWLSERMSAGPDALSALTWAAARTDRLKLGTAVTVLPGRNPVLLAKQLATLDRLSGGRLLPAFGLGVASGKEQQAFGVARDERGSRFDEMLPLIHRFWTEDTVDHKGRWFRYEKVKVRPYPVQEPLEVWLGGSAPSELDRCGRLGDGWLPSFVPPEAVAKGRARIEKVADKAGRSIDADHFGALVPYVDGSDIPDRLIALVRRRKPDVEPTDVVAQGLKGLRPLLERYIEAGASKFVVVPVVEPANWDDHVGDLADAVHPLET